MIGGSIGGLAAATALHRLGAHVRVFESSPTSFEGRGSSLGYCNVPLWEALCQRPMLRRGERSNRGQGGWLYGDLWTFLRVGLPDDVIKYNSTVTTLGDDPSAPVVEGEAYDVAIVADGGWSTLRKAYFDPAGKGPEYAGYVAWRFKLPTSALSPPFQAYGEYSAGHYTTILLDIIEDKGGDWIMGGTAVSTPESAVARPRAGENRQAGGGAAPAATEDADAAARAHVEWYSSKFAGAARGEAVRVLRAALDHGKVSPIPQFEYCAPRVTAGRLVLVGDAAHMASPRTASGAHTAVLDGAALFDAFAGTLGAAGAGAAGQPPGGWAALVDEALAAYGPGGLARARQLYRRSLEVSAQVMPRGWVRGGGRSDL